MKIIGVTDIGTGVRVLLAPGEDAIIAPGISVGSTDSIAVYGGDGSHNVRVEGNVLGDFAGIQLGDDPVVDLGNNVVIDADAFVSGGSWGVNMKGSYGSLDNRGQICGLYAVSMIGDLGGASTSKLINSGQIEGQIFGVFRSGAENFTLDNRGLISGSSAAFCATGTGNLLIVNTGKVVGQIVFDNGNDIYDGHAGHVSGLVAGSGGEDTIIGGVDNDYFLGGVANDTLRGNLGNDQLNGETGADRMFGGAGNDGYSVDNAGDIVSELGGSGIDLVRSSVSFSLSNTTHAIGVVENLTLLATASAGTGNAIANIVTGNSAGNVLNGLAGNDRLAGVAGIDKLYGGLGNDTLTGGSEKDFFVFNSAPNSSTNRDYVTDFVHGLDKFQMENAVFKALGAAGGLNAAFFYAGSAAHDTNDHIIYNKANGVLSYDADGNGALAPVQFAIVCNKPGLSAGDFAVI